MSFITVEGEGTFSQGRRTCPEGSRAAAAGVEVSLGGESSSSYTPGSRRPHGEGSGCLEHWLWAHVCQLYIALPQAVPSPTCSGWAALDAMWNMAIGGRCHTKSRERQEAAGRKRAGVLQAQRKTIFHRQNPRGSDRPYSMVSLTPHFQLESHFRGEEGTRV